MASSLRSGGTLIQLIISYLIALVLFVVQFCLADLHVGNLNQNNDHQFWYEQNLNIKLNEKWALIVHAGLRWGDDYKRLFFFRQWNILHYDLTEFIKDKFNIGKESVFHSFSIGPSFAKVWSIHGNTRGVKHWANSNHPGIVAFMTHGWCGWSLRQRMYGEYIDFVTPHYLSHGVYRHRALLETPWKFTCYKITPFISNEWFFRAEVVKHGKVVQSGPFHQNRFRIGLSAEFFKDLITDFWWQLRLAKQRSNSHPLWRKTYQIGMTINLQL